MKTEIIKFAVSVKIKYTNKSHRKFAIKDAKESISVFGSSTIDNDGEHEIKPIGVKFMKVLRKLKDLTPDECIKIASIIEPTINWKLIQPICTWEGYDLIDEDRNESMGQHIFQINYRDDKQLENKSRFRIYEDLYEYPIGTTEMKTIFDYLHLIHIEI